MQFWDVIIFTKGVNSQNWKYLPIFRLKQKKARSAVLRTFLIFMGFR